MADLPAGFPLLRTPATRPNNLPLQPTPFLGREDQVTRVVGRVLPQPEGGMHQDA